MKKVLYLLNRAKTDQSMITSPGTALERGLTEAGLDRIVAAGGSSQGSLGCGGNISSAAEWPPPPSRLN
jgi:hypothetical protein